MSVAATSIAAHKSLTRPVSKELRKTVFKAILYSDMNGMTIEEIANETGIKLQTVCARRNELDKKGLVIDSGNRRKTSSGRSAKVWIVPNTIAKAAKSRLVQTYKS